jgi:hypothetical protein
MQKKVILCTLDNLTVAEDISSSGGRHEKLDAVSDRFGGRRESVPRGGNMLRSTTGATGEIDRPRTGASVRQLPDAARWRLWVREHRVGAAVLAGLVATHIATVVGYWMPGIGLPQLDWNRVNGLIYTPKASPDVQFLSGGVFHYMDGVVFSVLFAVALFPAVAVALDAARECAERLAVRHDLGADQLPLHDATGLLSGRACRVLQSQSWLETDSRRVSVALGLWLAPRRDLQPSR